MSSPTTPNWQAPAPSFATILLATLRRSVTIALVVSLAFALYKVALERVAERPVDLLDIIDHAGLLFVALALVAYPFLLMWSTRSLRDRSFRVLGFSATFFGLVMLTVFFWEIGNDVAAWFEHTPRFVEAENKRLLALQEQLGHLGKMKQAKLDDLNRELEFELSRAATEEEKKELREVFEKEVIPEQMRDYDVTLAELQKTAEGSVREDTSPWGLFVYFLGAGPSTYPQDAGIRPALLGSIWIGLITILFAVPIGVGAAIYLEEFKSARPHIQFIQNIIQININNLAGVPSVVFGILGAFVFVELIFKPLESPYIAARNVLGGGLTLGLLTLPVVIVSAQEAIRAVPSSLRHGAYALGATHWQTIWTVVLPMARPGILTGTILALSRAVGEAAPLILFGALLFVNQDPSLFSRFTVMPMQIFGWSDRPPVNVPYQETSVEIWKYNAAVAIVLLLAVLLLLNGLAIWVRNRAQKRTRY